MPQPYIIANSSALLDSLTVHQALWESQHRAMYSTPESQLIERESGGPEEPEPKRRITPEQFEAAMAKLTPFERDIIELRFLAGKRERELAEVLGLTQAGISYRISRALGRLAFFVGPASWFTVEDIERDLRPHVRTKRQALQVDIFKALWGGAFGQSHVARALGITQGRARHNLLALFGLWLPQLAETDPTIAKYQKALQAYWKVKNSLIVADTPWTDPEEKPRLVQRIREGVARRKERTSCP
jgi:predicted XRE-type DNA-binding protein